MRMHKYKTMYSLDETHTHTHPSASKKLTQWSDLFVIMSTHRILVTASILPTAATVVVVAEAVAPCTQSAKSIARNMSSALAAAKSIYVRRMAHDNVPRTLFTHEERERENDTHARTHS